MKFYPGKMYPYPVLRPESDDYPRAEFQVEIEFKKVEKSTESMIEVEFVLSDPDLQKCVARKDAHYVVVVRCPTTHLRYSKSTFDKQLIVEFASGKIFGYTEVSPFLVATRPIHRFRAQGWHEDYIGMPPVDLETGTVLAVDTPKEYWVDNAQEARISSIFDAVPGGQVDGQWDCGLDSERIAITLSDNDYKRFCDARKQTRSEEEISYVMNGIYLPALYHVLVMADADADAYRERRWFRSLEARLEDVQAKLLGCNGGNRLRDAQKLLNSPFSRFPLSTTKEEGRF